MAAMPLPSPVKPMPSVVVAETETCTPPKADEIAAIASARRLPIFGRLPMICTLNADLTPTVKGGEYLDPEAAIDAIAAVANQGKK